jgi:hypothetical protein
MFNVMSPLQREDKPSERGAAAAAAFTEAKVNPEEIGPVIVAAVSGLDCMKDATVQTYIAELQAESDAFKKMLERGAGGAEETKAGGTKFRKKKGGAFTKGYITDVELYVLFADVVGRVSKVRDGSIYLSQCESREFNSQRVDRDMIDLVKSYPEEMVVRNVVAKGDPTDEASMSELMNLLISHVEYGINGDTNFIVGLYESRRNYIDTEKSLQLLESASDEALSVVESASSSASASSELSALSAASENSQLSTQSVTSIKQLNTSPDEASVSYIADRLRKRPRAIAFGDMEGDAARLKTEGGRRSKRRKVYFKKSRKR